MNIATDSHLEMLGLKIVLDNPTYITWFKEEYFTSPWIVIFRTIKNCDTKIDKNILLSKLTQLEQLNIVGGNEVINQIFDIEYEEDMIDEYINQLKELYIKRNAQIRLFSIIDRAPKIDVGDLFSAVNNVKETILADVGISLNDSDRFSSIIDDALDSIFSDKADINIVKTGFPSYDLLLGGGEKSNLEIIAARTSMGKTSYLLQLLLNSAKDGVSSELISYEMSNQQIALRAISVESGIPSQRLKRDAMTDEEKETLQETVSLLKSIPFNISYTASANIDELCNHIKIAHENSGIEVFGIDYVQLIPRSNRDESENIGLYKAVSRLKMLAKNLNILIYLVSQLNRSVDSRKNKIPMLTDLRQSGGLEESADKVIFIYRKHYYTLQEEDRGLAKLIVAKNRNGPIATFDVMFDENTTSFYELG